ncbi:tetratricopeptide repeat protein, partial [Patescibacteria group bacterium]|nr:tetratricopeptide repeat protein [Patescibacteria group bacterium]
MSSNKSSSSPSSSPSETDAQTYYELSQTASMLGNTDEALKHIRKAIEIQGDNAELRQDLSLILSNKYHKIEDKNSPQAAELLLEINERLKDFGDNTQERITRIMISLNTENWDDAQKFIEEHKAELATHSQLPLLFLQMEGYLKIMQTLELSDSETDFSKIMKGLEMMGTALKNTWHEQIAANSKDLMERVLKTMERSPEATEDLKKIAKSLKEGDHTVVNTQDLCQTPARRILHSGQNEGRPITIRWTNLDSIKTTLGSGQGEGNY